MSGTGCSITLLRPHEGRLATKRVTPEGVVPIEPTTLHEARSLPLGGFWDLVKVLTALIEAPRWYAVRGQLAPGVDTTCMRRLHKDPSEATLLELPRRWVLLDVDSWKAEELDSKDFLANPEACAAAARAQLPEGFRNAQCFWYATSSAGFKSGARLRLAFWLDRPVGNEEWRAHTPDKRLGGLPVDTSLFTPSQPHYTARPVFDGVEDPLPGDARYGVLPGADTASVTPPAPVVRLTDDRAEKALAKAVKEVAKAGENRHNTLNKGVYFLALRFAPEDLPDARIIKELVAASLENGTPPDVAREAIERALRDGRAKRSAEYDGWRKLLARDEKTDRAKATAANVSLYIEHHPAFSGKLSQDVRTQGVFWLQAPPWRDDTGPFTESDTAYFGEWFQTQAELDVRPSWVNAGVIKAASLRPYDGMQAWLKALPKWDGVPRFETLPMRYLGVDDTRLNRAMFTAWGVQAVQRAFSTLDAPARADHTLVVRSELQGVGKSTFFRSLCPLPRYFRDELPALGTKDASLAVADAWIVELGEMSVRRRDANTTKAFLTSVKDKVRPPYARFEVEIPRRCVFVGTTNEDEFLSDVTGNRRYWVMSANGGMHPAKIEASLRAERDQLWAEVVAMVQAGARPYLPADLAGEAAAAAESVREKGVAEEPLRKALARPVDKGSIQVDEGLQINPSGHVVAVSPGKACELLGRDPLDGRVTLAVSRALRALGWVAGKRTTTRRASGWGPGARLWTPPQGWQYEERTMTQGGALC